VPFWSCFGARASAPHTGSLFRVVRSSAGVEAIDAMLDRADTPQGLLADAHEQRGPEHLNGRQPRQHERHRERIRRKHVGGQCTINASHGLARAGSQRPDLDSAGWAVSREQVTRMSPSDTRRAAACAHARHKDARRPGPSPKSNLAPLLTITSAAHAARYCRAATTVTTPSTAVLCRLCQRPRGARPTAPGIRRGGRRGRLDVQER
jgi:hypothetical protein